MSHKLIINKIFFGPGACITKQAQLNLTLYGLPGFTTCKLFCPCQDPVDVMYRC